MKIKSNFDSSNFYKSEIAKCETLLKKMDQNSDILKKKSELPYLGEQNMQSLEYSYTKTVKNNADQTYMETKNVIKNLENELKLTPLIDKEDATYKNFMSYNETKNELKQDQKKLILKRFGYLGIGVIILAVIFLILHKSQKVEDIKMEEKDAI